MGIIRVTGFTETQKALLAKDLDKKRVAKREGSGGKSFDYLAVWDVEDRANQIFGFDGWSCETVELIETWSGTRKFGRDQLDKPVMVFRAKVRVTVYAGERVIIKEAWGYGDGSGKDFGEASELAIKESESDAEKRAFKKFGWQFGLALYDKTQEHVRAGADNEPVETPQEQAPPPPPPPPAAEKPKAAVAPAPKPAKEDRPDPGAPKVRKFDAPVIPDGAAKAKREQIWRDWTTQISAAIKSAPDEDNARATLKANLKTLGDLQKAIGFDAVKWATDLIEKRWPPAESAAADESTPEADAADNEANIIPPPNDDEYPDPNDLTSAWDDWLDLLQDAINSSPDIASGRDVITANKPSFQRCGEVVEIDVPLWAQTKLEAKFGAKQKRSR